ncbi:9281_t:CDS:10 [Scutellospora calospora]|uniref:9281_t:CDS:1 n=1 Tax=Scutellospora calospora TaxID=85575 RepID=A0ACA9JW86_9GLOM|nr:9281_t:CDS:10 [Scutellospora calospora]
MAVLYYNERYTYLFSELQKIYNKKPFEIEDLLNISIIEKESEKYANEHKELEGFKFDKELVYYKAIAEKRLCDNEFYPSFASSINDFDKERLINSNIIIEDETNYPTTLKEYVKIIVKEIFKFSELRSGQIDAIKYYIEEEKDTLVIMKTDSRKSFCYATSSIIFDGLTVVISLLKFLIQSQVRTIEYKARLFKEIALGFTCLLYITPEKLLLNNSVKKLCNCLYYKKKLQFVINEAHCIFEFHYFRNLGMLKNLFPEAQIIALTATLSQDDVETLQDNLNITYFKITKSTDLLCMDLGIKNCSDILVILNQKMEEISLDLMIATSAFGLDIDMPNVCLVLHYNFPMNMISLIQASDWAEQDQQGSKCIILYTKKDIHTNYIIIADNRERHSDDKVQQTDVKLEILELIKVVKLLYENNDKPIIPLDIVEIFCCLDNERLRDRKLKLIDNHPKPKHLCIKVLAKLALMDLVHHGLIKQTILLKRKTNKNYLISSIIIEGVADNAESLAQKEMWSYWLKK